MKLGLLPHRPAQLLAAPRLSAYLQASPQAPVRLDRSTIAYRPQMWANDTLGDCTAAALANTALAIGALEQFVPVVSQEAVLALYSATSGYVPGRPETDRGAVFADVLQYQCGAGWNTGREVFSGPWATLEAQDLGFMRSALVLFGAVQLGVALSISDQNMAVWDTETPAAAGDPTPGSWGLHALVLWDYTGTAPDDVVHLATWGRLQPATWRWVARRTDEAHIILWRSLLSSTGYAWNGLDYEGLRAAAARMDSA
jgi:hypothetical protein